MSKNSETIKAIEGLESDQKQVVEELLQIIGQLVQRFDEEAIEYRKSLMENCAAFGSDPEDYSDNPEAYYDKLTTLISGLIDELNASLVRFGEIASSYTKHNPEIEEIAADQQRAAEQIWEIVNELSKYTEEDEEDEEDEEVFEIIDDELVEEESLPYLLEYLKRKLMDFEENIAILIKLYNSNPKLPKLPLPTLFFSSSDSLASNPLVYTLAKRGIDLD